MGQPYQSLLVVVVRNYYNEFDPYTWTLYIDKDRIPEFPTLLILPLFMTATVLVAILYKRKKLSTIE